MHQIQFLDASDGVIAERSLGAERDAAFAAFDAACREADAGKGPEGAVVIAMAENGRVHRRYRVKEVEPDADDREAAKTADGVRERAADSAEAAGGDAAAASGKAGGNAAKTAKKRAD